MRIGMLLLWAALPSAAPTPVEHAGKKEQVAGPDELRFGADGQFRITVFSDLHFGEEAWWRDCPECATYDTKTLRVINDVLGWEPTELAVLNGDLLSAEAVGKDNYTEYIDRIVQPLIARDIPWASTYGNHDRAENASPVEMLRKEQSYNTAGKKRAWTSNAVQGTDGGVGSSNYYVPVYGSTGDSVALVLWFFDSRAGDAFGAKVVQLEDFVAPEVVNWYSAQQTGLRKTLGRAVPSLAFVHIPFKPSLDLQEQRRSNFAGLAIAPGINGEAVGHQGNTCTGGHCDYNGKDAPFINALAATEGLIGVFTGHNHKIDWCMKWANTNQKASTKHQHGVRLDAGGSGINVCNGRRTGYGGYGKEYAKGARKIVVQEDRLAKGELETWVRLEDGRVSGHVWLNATYGVDKYPPAVGRTATNTKGGAS